MDTLFRVEHGNPTQEELAVTAAALLAVLRARADVTVPQDTGAGSPHWFAERLHRSPRPWSSR
ncbi:acyl-CoA carboxylase epsilon subunit [Streptomyces tateyamensis]|uniref:acyl-CoA carboxylase epsilon subunit n=1 Tax=Streptomyces tateyamensis TaxID=565073 RepID=UPI0015E8E8D7|nr:acyl-CoA carboxylase epsilon subunit [Streptomyces tateyamensis]